MNARSRRQIGVALALVASLLGLLYAASRLLPKLMRRMMRSGMQAMMRERMGAGGACSASEM
ncbi:MAG: hypothetical protein M1482_02200 [Chloroflexi bacterium]|nr:hypothetical protein [Chloroflexota bacterium]